MQGFALVLGLGATALVAMTIGYGFYLRTREDAAGTPAAVVLRRRARWLLSVDGVVMLGLMVWAIAALVFPGKAGAEEAAAAAGSLGADSLGEGMRKGLGYVGAGLSTGCAAIGAGIGVGIAGAAGIGAISEKPAMLGKSLIYVGLAEGVAIYGLLISILILNRV
jgi:V/A-type H+/Na+-transporting ATPase subunit K